MLPHRTDAFVLSADAMSAWQPAQTQSRCDLTSRLAAHNKTIPDFDLDQSCGGLGCVLIYDASA